MSSGEPGVCAMRDKDNVGHKIRQLREAQHLSLEQLADRSKVNKKLIE